MSSAIDSVNNFLRYYRNNGHNAPDLLDRFLEHGRNMETQVNVLAIGEKVEGKRSTYTDGEYTWWNYRIPWKADSEPEFRDYELGWPLETYAAGIGSTGWDWVERRSRWVGFDFDAIVGHAKGVGIGQAELLEVREAASALPYVEVRKSTSGSGLHLYVLLDEPTSNHTEHAALARAVLGCMSRDAKFDFSGQIDAFGGVMWLWHRKMSAENEGLTLVKASSELLTVPANWRDHIQVVSRKRAKVKVNGIQESVQDVFEALASAHRRVPLDDTHRLIITELDKHNPTNWVDDHGLLQCHTKSFDHIMNGLEPCPVCSGTGVDPNDALADDFGCDAQPCPNCKDGQVPIAQRLGLSGVFATNSPGTDLASYNAFAFPLDNGSFKLYRFSPGVAEDPTWEQDGRGWTTCTFNVQPDLKTAARAKGGRELKSGGYEFNSAQHAIEVARLMNPNADIEVEPILQGRKAVLRTTKSGQLSLEIRKQAGDPHELGQWSDSDKRSFWAQVVPITAEPPKPLTHDYDNVIRCLDSPANTPAGWAIRKDNGDWVRKSASSVKTVLQYLGNDKTSAEIIMGRCEKQSWKLVRLPFAPEYPGSRQWNWESPQLRFEPISRGTEPYHPHWDLILNHCGNDLTPYLRQLDWAAQSNIYTGADYLRAWYASIIRDPLCHLPFLVFFGPENSGKSIMHESFELLVTSGVVKADRALTSTNDFNGELEGAILTVIEEKDLSKSPGARAKLKEAVTAERHSIRRMRQDPYMVDNTTHWNQMVNNLANITLDPGDTRVTIIHVPPFAPPEIPKPLLKERLIEEAPSYLRTLLDMDLPAPMGRLRVPVVTTEYKQRVEDLAKSSLDVFLDDKVEPAPDKFLSFSEFYNTFLEWLSPEELANWSRIKVSRGLPTKYRVVQKTDNKSFLSNAKWKDNK